MNDWQEILAKVLPVEQVYKDLAQPAVQQVGQAAEGIVKAARFLLAPWTIFLRKETAGPGICNGSLTRCLKKKGSKPILS